MVLNTSNNEDTCIPSQNLQEMLRADPDSQRQRMGELSRKVTILRVNEKTLSRRYTLLHEAEAALRKVGTCGDLIPRQSGNEVRVYNNLIPRRPQTRLERILTSYPGSEVRELPGNEVGANWFRGGLGVRLQCVLTLFPGSLGARFRVCINLIPRRPGSEIRYPVSITLDN